MKKVLLQKSMTIKMIQFISDSWYAKAKPKKLELSMIVLLFFIFTFPMFTYAAEGDVFRFSEIWAYVLAGEEGKLKGTEPITDLAYFSAPVTETGRVTRELTLDKLPKALRSRCRVHLVISAPNNRSLMYWCLSKDREAKQDLLNDILRLSAPYDGVQIDFETIRPEDRHAFWDFLKELKSRLPRNKILSVGVLARFKDTQDAFNYQEIAAVADKVIVMAYDEHWQSGQPGAIASLGWCEKIHSFATNRLASKLVMGIPLYGRVWQKQQIAKSLKYPQTLDLWKKHQPMVKRLDDGTPHFEFKETVDALAFYEDIQSLCKKLAFYQNEGVKAIALWRISQEPAAFWNCIQTDLNP